MSFLLSHLQVRYEWVRHLNSPNVSGVSSVPGRWKVLRRLARVQALPLQAAQ